MSPKEEILEAIAEFARGYARLETLQGPSSLMPGGDQKIRCIGGFYARLHLDGVEPAADVKPGGDEAWDLEVRMGGAVRRVLVKTVSAYSATRLLSPILEGWNELWVISLNTAFKPDGFWIVDLKGLDARFPIRGVQAPLPEGAWGSPGPFTFGPNRVSELRAHIQEGA